MASCKWIGQTTSAHHQQKHNMIIDSNQQQQEDTQELTMAMVVTIEPLLLKILASSNPVFLQFCQHWCQGLPVFLWDALRQNTDLTAAPFQASFNIYQILSKYLTNQTQGLVLIHIMHYNNVDKMTAKSTQMVTKTFPIKFKVIQSFDCMEKNNLFAQGFVQGLIGIFMHFITPSKVHFYTLHCQQERERNVQILEEQHGLTQELVPCSIGGTWKYKTFDEWLMQCMQEKRQLHLIDVHMHNSLESHQPT